MPEINTDYWLVAKDRIQKLIEHFKNHLAWEPQGMRSESNDIPEKNLWFPEEHSHE